MTDGTIVVFLFTRTYFMMKLRLKALGTLLKGLVFCLLSGNLCATWSIIIIDTRTGEIAIGSATCIVGADLRSMTAVLVVGKGGACAQSYVDASGNNRILIFNGFKSGMSPSNILAALATADPGHQTRQYGFVDTEGRALGFTGSGAGAWGGHLTGTIGTLTYAIQGNVLTGRPVITEAEKAVRNTPGDLAAKLMAGMEAARKMGGDGRCSCQQGPTACGSPPRSFNKSAHIAFMVIGRFGDSNGSCGSAGCARGRYYMAHDVRGHFTAPDPVATLWDQYFKWRKGLLGRPDHNLSTVDLQSSTLPADGKTKTTITVQLRDYRGGAVIKNPGTTLTVSNDPKNTAALQIGPVSYHTDGRYTFSVTAAATVGLGKLRIVANDRQGSVRLSPVTVIPITPAKLWSSHEQMSVTRGANLEFVINQGGSNANRPYILLASNSGTSPGITLSPSITIPLNPDPVFWAVFYGAGTTLPGFLGQVDTSGRRSVGLPLPAGLYGLPLNTDLHFATTMLTPIDNVSTAVGIRIVQ